jgi:hypothetical protein
LRGASKQKDRLPAWKIKAWMAGRDPAGHSLALARGVQAKASAAGLENQSMDGKTRSGGP